MSREPGCLLGFGVIDYSFLGRDMIRVQSLCLPLNVFSGNHNECTHIESLRVHKKIPLQISLLTSRRVSATQNLARATPRRLTPCLPFRAGSWPLLEDLLDVVLAWWVLPWIGSAHLRMEDGKIAASFAIRSLLANDVQSSNLRV